MFADDDHIYLKPLLFLKNILMLILILIFPKVQ